MLRLLVLRNMLQQSLLIVKAFVARVTLVGLVSLVTPRVGLQVRQLGERLGAAWNKSNRKKCSSFSLHSQSHDFCQSINFNWTKSGWRRQKSLLQTANDIVTFSATSPTNSSFINVSYELANWGEYSLLAVQTFNKIKRNIRI